MTTETCPCQDIKYLHDAKIHTKLSRTMATKIYSYRQKKINKYTTPYPEIMNELERFKQLECAEFGDEYTPKHYTYEALSEGDYLTGGWSPLEITPTPIPASSPPPENNSVYFYELDGTKTLMGSYDVKGLYVPVK